MNVLIATPTAANIVTTAYTHSLIAATQAFHAAGWRYKHLVFDSADVEMARNYMASEFLKDQKLTHILFLDSDMLVERKVFYRLIQADHPVAGAIYTHRSMNWAHYAQMIGQGASDPVARATSSRFNVRTLGNTINIRKGWCQVAGLGAGCLMIQRKVFETLLRSGRSRSIRNAHLAASFPGLKLYDFFTCITREDGDKLSEDYSFCERALGAGFDIWGLADEAVAHVGRQDFSARYIDFLSHTATVQGSHPSDG